MKKMPVVVYVEFEKADWKIEGLRKPGLYPIRCIKKVWYLDQGRPVPKSKITRQQLPLAPAFACTAHFAQGKTLPAAVVDLCIGEDASPLTG